MTMLKSLEKKKKSRAHSLSASGSGSEVEARPSQMAAESTVEKSSGAQSSRKRKRTEDSNSGESRPMSSSENVMLNRAETMEKVPKAKKRKVSQPVTSNTDIQPETEETPNDSSASQMKEEENEDYYSAYIDPTTASLLFEDLTEDEDVWLLQCPKFINPEILVGNKINLSSKSAVECKLKDSTTLKLDSYPVNYEPGTSKINIVLPSRNEGTLKIGVSDLQGKIILTEQVLVPEIDYEAIKNNAPKEEISFPSNLKIRHPLLGIDSPNPLRKKKRKQSNIELSSRSSKETEVRLSTVNEANATEIQGSSAEMEKTPVTKSKKKKKQSQDSSVVEGIDTITLSEGAINSKDTTSSSFMQKITPSNTSHSSIIMAGDLSFRDVSQVDGVDLSVCQESDLNLPKSKKKKRKHQAAGDVEALTPEIKIESQDVDNLGISSPPKSKKKKKHDKSMLSDSETIISDFKYEPRDPLEINADDLGNGALSKTKKKKKRHNSTVPSDSETPDFDFKYEPRDPLEITADDIANISESSSKKKKKKRRESMMNHSETIHPDNDDQLVLKTEFDVSSIEIDNTSTKSSHQERKKSGDRSAYGSADFMWQNNSQLNNESSNFNINISNDSSSKKRKKSLMVNETEEVCNLAEESNNLLDQSSRKSKKKKKERLSNETDDVPAFQIKLEPNFDANQTLPSFLDSLSNNYEFETPDVHKSPKKKKKKNRSDDD